MDKAGSLDQNDPSDPVTAGLMAVAGACGVVEMATQRRTADRPANIASGAGFTAGVREIYRASVKPTDILFNVWVARPIAAMLLYFLRRTRVTPNQLSMLGLAVFAAVPCAMIALPDWRGFLLAAVVLEVSYVFDCCDGQLARLQGMTSGVGAYLDFLIDEIKALLLIGGVAVSLWLSTGADSWLLFGVGAVAAVSISTSLTTFIRRPEYAGTEVLPGTHVTGGPAPQGLLRRLVWLVVGVLRLVVHYPSWIWLLALAGIHPAVDPQSVFALVYGGVFLLYLGRTSLAVALRLGSRSFYSHQTRPAPPT